jgi:hypothetical protein
MRYYGANATGGPKLITRAVLAASVWAQLPLGGLLGNSITCVSGPCGEAGHPIFAGYEGRYDKDLAMKHATEEYARFLVRLRKEDTAALN